MPAFLMPSFLSGDLLELLKSFAVFIVVASLALGFRALAFRGLTTWASRTPTLTDDILLQHLRLPSIMLCLLLGLYAGIYSSPETSRITTIALHGTYALLVITVTVAVANFSEAMLRSALKEKHLILPATDLSMTIVKLVMWTVGVLVLLSGLGVSITPMVTALGIGGLAVSLALQDTLSNFFAGIHLLVDKPIRIGDFVKLESGQEGFVSTIGWRTTRLRMRSNDVVIVPNNKFIQSTLVMFPEPEKATSDAIRDNVGRPS
jgi:small-conductance mechanosensitive channel